MGVVILNWLRQPSLNCPGSLVEFVASTQESGYSFTEEMTIVIGQFTSQSSFDINACLKRPKNVVLADCLPFVRYCNIAYDEPLGGDLVRDALLGSGLQS